MSNGYKKFDNGYFDHFNQIYIKIYKNESSFSKPKTKDSCPFQSKIKQKKYIFSDNIF